MNAQGPDMDYIPQDGDPRDGGGEARTGPAAQATEAGQAPESGQRPQPRRAPGAEAGHKPVPDAGQQAPESGQAPSHGDEAYELLARGLELLDSGHNHQAAIALERARELEPEKASIREALARAFYNSGQIKNAEKEFEAALQIDPADHYGHFGLGLCRARLGDKAGAIGMIKMALAMRPDSEDYQHALRRLAG
ncbi:MAG: tetratricopeptide repeat protein [Actinomycetota bacterium]